MASKGYTTKAAVNAYLGKDSGLSDAVLDGYIQAVEAVIDGMTGRNFKADAAASARVYDGTGTPELVVDDCVAVTKVEVGLDTYGGDFIEVSGSGADRYFLLPNNYAALGVPVTLIELSARDFPKGRQNARVTAKWGYSAAPPDDLAFAAAVFTAGIVNFRNNPGAVRSERIGNYSVSYDGESSGFADYAAAKASLMRYRRYEI